MTILLTTIMTWKGMRSVTWPQEQCKWITTSSKVAPKIGYGNMLFIFNEPRNAVNDNCYSTSLVTPRFMQAHRNALSKVSAAC